MSVPDHELEDTRVEISYVDEPDNYSHDPDWCKCMKCRIHHFIEWAEQDGDWRQDR